MVPAGARWRRRLALWVGACCLVVNALAANTQTTPATPTTPSGPKVALDASHLAEPVVPLVSYLETLEDPSLVLTLDEVQSAAGASRFQAPPTHDVSLDYGLTDSAYWMRLPLRNTSDQPVERLLEIGWANLGDVRFYQPDAQGAYQASLTGSGPPFASRPYRNRYFVFPITLPAHSEQLYFLRFQSTAPLIVPARLWEPQAFHAHERDDYLAQAWYFGIATAMILFNFLLFLGLRDAIYLQYVAFVSLGALTLATENGLTKEFLWNESPFWSNIAPGVGYTLSFGAMLIFTRTMLNTRTLMPRFDRVLQLLVGVLLLLPLAMLVDYHALIKPTTFLYIITCLLVMGTGIYALYLRQRSAVFFVAAFTLLMFGGLLVGIRNLGLLPTNVFTINGMQIGSALEMLLLAFALADRFNIVRRDKAQAQRDALAAERRLVDGLRASERQLEDRVAQRTGELRDSVSTLANTLNDLRATQAQLIQSEKMASLGQLVANVAHEINSPIGAVKSSGTSIALALDGVLDQLPALFQKLDAETRQRFMALIRHAKAPTDVLSTREERAITREVVQQLEDAGIADARRRAGMLVQLHLHTVDADTLLLLRHPESDLILASARGVAEMINSTDNINRAVERVSKIVFALKSFSRVDSTGEMVETDLKEGIETILTIYQSQIKQGSELVTQFDAVPTLRCLPDELNQVWINLIHNALQAMNHRGTLTIGLRRQDGEAVVSVGDTGCGIPEAIRSKIFDAFFTTKATGEGSGLGLDIVKKIIDKHRGRIEVQSTVDVGTTFLVYLPLNGPTAPVEYA